MRIPDDVQYVLSELQAHGHKAYLVGGCVRDFLLGRAPQDFDAATDAPPEETMRVFSAGRVIPTGLAHGTVTVLHGAAAVEVTTFRTDGSYGDGRHPDFVRFSDSLTEDLARRDFTVNAIAMDAAQTIIDPYGGESDLHARILRAVGDPTVRMTEDALRILRAFRFASTLDFEIEPQTLDAALALAPRLSLVSRERIFAEIEKLLCGRAVSRVLSQMLSGGLFSHIFSAPRLNDRAPAYLEQLPRRADVRMAALLLYDPLAGEHIGSLKPSSSFMHRVTAILNCPPLLGLSAPNLRRIAAKVGREAAADRAQIEGGESGREDACLLLQKILSEEDCFSVRDLKINGQDVIMHTALRGKQVGEALNRILYAVFDGKIQNTRSEELDFLQTIMSSASNACKKVDKT